MFEQVSFNEALKKQKKISSNYIFLFLVCFFVLAAGIFIIINWNIESTDNAQVDGHIINIAARIDGQISEIYTDNNKQVKTGQLLFKLDDSLLIQNQKNAQADYASSVVELHKTLLNIKKLYTNYLSFKSELDLQRKNFFRSENLKLQGAITNLSFDQQKNLLEQAKANFEGAKATLAMPENKIKIIDRIILLSEKDKLIDELDLYKGISLILDEAIVQVHRSQANLAKANINLGYAKVYAPFDGVTANKNAEIGKNVNANVPLISLVDLTNTWIVANFKEDQLKNMRVGQQVEIKIDMYGKRKFNGVVTSFSPASGERFSLLPPDNASGNYVKVTQRFPVRIDFLERPSDVTFRPGMSAIVKVKAN